jgi:hypothetical protein
LRRILDINPKLEQQIEEVINTKGFRDFQHFALIALENQIAWETGNPQLNNQTTHIDSQILQFSKGLYPSSESTQDIQSGIETLLTMPAEASKIPDLSVPDNPNKILWGQYYRFLPVKVGVRVLLNMSKEELPELGYFTEKITGIAISLRHQLAKLDRQDKRSFGDLLSASFPTNDEKSVKRFVNQFMIYPRASDMTLLGMMPELKLVNITSDKEGKARIGLTSFGRQFALLQNPVLDLNRPQALSDAEINFLLNHIADNIPAEFEHINFVLESIRNGKQSRSELNTVLKQYYSRYQKDMQWSNTVVNTMRSGLISRLKELGLVRRVKNGKNVTYFITKA